MGSVYRDFLYGLKSLSRDPHRRYEDGTDRGSQARVAQLCSFPARTFQLPSCRQRLVRCHPVKLPKFPFAGTSLQLPIADGKITSGWSTTQPATRQIV
jgi:hypothetical protein